MTTMMELRCRKRFLRHRLPAAALIGVIVIAIVIVVVVVVVLVLVDAVVVVIVVVEPPLSW